MPFYERQPFIQPLPSLLLEVLRGEIRVPRFQRPGTEITWTPEQRGDLLDSVYRGFPIGTVFQWSTHEKIRTLEKIGGFPIPPPDQGRPQRVLLDGHQRLSTLIAVFGRSLVSETATAWRGVDEEQTAVGEGRPAWWPVLQEDWRFDLTEPDAHDRRTRDRFVLVKDPASTEGSSCLPLAIALNRVEMNRWVREQRLEDEQILLADQVRDRFREYSIPVAVLSTNSLEEATESFKRINSSGTPMSDFHMVNALVYRDDFDLADRFYDLRQEVLDPLGWADVSESDLLRVCAGLLPKQHPSKLDVSRLSRALRQDPDLVRRAFDVIAKAAEWLGTWGIHSPKALPYSWQLITLSILLGQEHGLAASNPDHKAAARRWFWRSTYGGVFGGVNSAVYDRASEALKDMARGRGDSRMQRDISPRVEEVTRFDFRSARAKACALAMARYQDRDDLSGTAHRALAERGSDALVTVRGKGRRSEWSELAIATAETSVAAIREAVRNAAPDKNLCDEDRGILTQLGFTDMEADTDTMIQRRKETLLEAERSFVRAIGLEWSEATPAEGDASTPGWLRS